MPFCFAPPTLLFFFFLTTILLRPPGAEAAAGPGPLQQLLPAAPGRGLAGEDHLAVPLLPAAGPHRLPQRADWLPGGAPRHV